MSDIPKELEEKITNLRRDNTRLTGGQDFLPGHVYIAPGHSHLLVRRGAAGFKAAYEQGDKVSGHCQDRETSVVFGMPRVAISLGASRWAASTSTSSPCSVFPDPEKGADRPVHVARRNTGVGAALHAGWGRACPGRRRAVLSR